MTDHQQQQAVLTCQHILRPPLQEIGEGDDRLVYEIGQPAWQCSFSKDGNHLAVCYGAPQPCIRIWEMVHKFNDKKKGTQWILQSTLSGVHERTVRSVVFAPIMKPLILASASFDGSIAIWEASTRNETLSWECTAQLEGHENEVKCVVFNETGSLLASSGRDKTVWIWECFLPGTVGGPSEGSEASEFECIAVLNGHEADVKCVRFAPSHDQWGDGAEILLSSSYDDTIRVWAEDAGDWYCAASISGVHSSTIWSLALAPSGARLVSGSADASLAIYKAYTIAEKKRLFPEDKDQSNSHGVWKCVGKLTDAHYAAVYAVDYAPAQAGHGRVVSAGADGDIHIYREAMGSTSDRPLFSLEASVDAGHNGDVNHVRWHPFLGSVLASVGDDGAVRIWKYQTA